MEFTGTAQGQARSAGVGVFASVANEDDGYVKLPLQLAQIRQERGNLTGIIFVNPVQSDQRIQD